MRPLAIAATALIALASAAPATAAPVPTPGTPPKAQSRLFLTVSGDQDTWIRGVLLRCAPRVVSGHHPHAAEACAALDAAHGDLGALPVERRICTHRYSPVTVSATGLYQGRILTWKKTFANTCAMEAATGYVFRF
ncbi:SSI family serine proteinase inhibitor [Streptomyces himalayensis]|uniref:Protease inhibitor SIL-V5 n=2 Tax=Streptomyces himalayensis TaxID=2820085 RepID=A0A7W2D692_9ACTN|nr:SSI family serine proteinase inhibitor [Streptomyces himalayensis]MBA2946943.1 protease inhibitor SIL-V5 [Streptomyces himalayensis subsp. himalayensis]MBA4865240.1 protease inhibitor SIL-V5 [Streptomyces himalayensis subsp. aureolus]